MFSCNYLKTNIQVVRLVFVGLFSVVSSSVFAGELIVQGAFDYSSTLPWSPTSVVMFDQEAYYDTFPIGSNHPTLVSPNSSVTIGSRYQADAWASASPGVLKVRATMQSSPFFSDVIAPGFFGTVVRSQAYFGDSLTYSKGGSRDMVLSLSFSVPHKIALPKETSVQIVPKYEWSGDTPTLVGYRGYAQDYSAGLLLGYSSTFVDRDSHEKEGVSLQFSDEFSTCGGCTGAKNDFPDGKITVKIPFVEGLPFSYEVGMIAFAGIYLDQFGTNLGSLPGLAVPGAVAASLADRSMYFIGANIFDKNGVEYGLDGISSSLGMNYSQSTLVPEPRTIFMMFGGLVVLFLFPTKKRIKHL